MLFRSPDLAGLLPAEKFLLSFRIWYRILHLPVIHFHILYKTFSFLFSVILCFFCFKFSNYFYYRFYCTKMRDTNSVSRIIFLSFKFLPVLFWNELRIIRQLIPRYKPEVPAMKFLPVLLPAGYQSGNSPVSRLLQLSMHTEAGLLHG